MKNNILNHYIHKGKQIVIIGANISSKLLNTLDWKGEFFLNLKRKPKNILPKPEE